MTELTAHERVELMDLMIRLREVQPMGIVGLLETRNLLANLFPQFDSVRDPELDELIHRLIESIKQEDEAISEQLDNFDPDDYMTQEELDS